MELLDDLVDVPKQPKVRESFIAFFTKRETFYLTIFLGLAGLSIRLPLGIIINTFVFGMVLFIGAVFTFHRYRGRNFDRWVFDYVLFKIKALKGRRLVYRKDYKYNFMQNQLAIQMVWWQRLLCTMPLLGSKLEKRITKKTNHNQGEAEKEEELFNAFTAGFELDDLEEQIKGILNVHFFYEWQDVVKQDKSLEYADASRLLLTLENIIENSSSLEKPKQ